MKRFRINIDIVNSLVANMLSKEVSVFCILIVAVWSKEYKFPATFKFGVASAAYQMEGAWNISDKGESIWDRFTHTKPGAIRNGDNGDVACDSYHLWREDVDVVAEVGAQFYRISISWPRLLPNGLPHKISEDGKKYYNNLIDGLLEKGIEPVITLYHWDLPQKLQDLGGWANPLITEWFGDYARVAYSLYGDRVKIWITINEAFIMCELGYMAGIMAPGFTNHVGGYICNKNVLMAHAKAWRIYDEEFKPKYGGQVSLANHLIWMEAKNEAEEETAELARQFQVGRYSHAIYSKEGGWPPAIEESIAAFSKEQGYKKSILPTWTKQEIDFVKGTYDFFGINFYTSRVVRKAHPGEQNGPWPLHGAPEVNAVLSLHPDWPIVHTYFAMHPEGLRKQLAWLKNEYGDIPMMITENGRATNGGLNDTERIYFYREHLKQILLSIHEDHVNVTAYTAWTIMDNFEWNSGYDDKFGLYEVDFTSATRRRTARASAKYYTQVIRTHSVDAQYNFTMPKQRSTSTEQNNNNNTHTTIFAGLVMVIIIVIVTAIVAWRLKTKKKCREEKTNGVHSTNGATRIEESKILLKQ